MLPVSCLILPGVIVKKLLGAGFVYVEDLFSNSNELQPDAERILQNYPEAKDLIIESLKPPPKISAKDLLKFEENQSRIICFSYMLDKILGGGIPLGQVLEVCGPPGSGKTQLCLQLCVSAQLHSCMGGLEAESVYVDTDAGFSPQRISEIGQSCKAHCCKLARANKFSNDLISSLESQRFTDYYYTPVGDYFQLLATVLSLDDFIKKHNKVKLVVIDSLAFPFLQLKDMLKRTILLCRIVRHLSRLALNHNLAIVVTNHLTTRISRGEDQLIPALGECVGHLLNSRLMLGYIHKDSCYGGIIYKSPVLSNDSAVFKITEGGIRDQK